jgi:hypothetical protein
MADIDTIGQARIDIAELKGMLSQSLLENGRRLTAVEDANKQFRVDLTAVNDNLNLKIADVVATVGIHSANIAEIRVDISEVNLRQNAMLGRAMSVASPLLALSSLVYSILVAGNHN